MSFFAFYPPAGSGVANPSIGVNGAIAPTSSTEVGGINPSGNLQPLQTDASGNLLVSLAAEPINPFNTRDAADATVGAPVGATVIQLGAQAPDATVARLLTDDAGNLEVVANNLSTITTGGITGGATLTIDPDPVNNAGMGTVAIRVTGGTSGSLILEGGVDTSGIYTPIDLIDTQSGAVVTSIVLPSSLMYQASISGLAQYRLRGVSVVGTATIHANINPIVSVVAVRNPIPTGTNTIGSINNISGTISLPTGASTSALQTTGNTSLSSIDGKLNSLGQKTSAASVPVVIASDQSAIPVSGTVTATNAANGTPGAAAPGTATQVAGSDGTNLRTLSTTAAGVLNVSTAGQTIGVTQSTIPWADNISQFGGNPVITGTGASGIGIPRVTVSNDSGLTQGSTTSGQSGTLVQGAVTTAAPTYTTAQTSPLSLTTAGALRTDASGSTQPVSGTVAATQSGTWTVQPGNTANTTPWLVKESVSATATNSNVASSASSVTILASNANRLTATVFNDSTAILYLNLVGNTASTTNYTVQLVSNAYYELPPAHIYTGAITGIWASANGNARVTELS